MIELNKQEKSELADRVYKLTDQLNRALRDAAISNIFSSVVASPSPIDPQANGDGKIYFKLIVHVFEHVDFPDTSNSKSETPKSQPSEGDQP